ncbi:MAG TPA: hypothetical protein DEA57_01425 [Sulfurihydrogenibium sp.]|uniref:Eco57I restriction-modification methylase domain-containing protein n=1 Tax=Sulfurihydrogenibium sp. (strain YO3AOP1) TaxID=436114 RepID=UPI0001722E1C|nr:Eco57I restriction-modification methylase domain-containing protein [Sulfurihydrogenibium sp. YO3AOP1]ACD65861.1 conserved hypothetical protein [Sulfurihydrogenibium sp. YO3AOP1]HBT98134.1 hypothetical protein [Sulfurihydrogenibium sp.]
MNYYADHSEVFSYNKVLSKNNRYLFKFKKVNLHKNNNSRKDSMIELNPFAAIHLYENERIKLGAFYTPPHVVDKVFELINPYLNNMNDVVVADIAAGGGAFLFPCLALSIDYRAADYDDKAISFLKQYFSHEKIFKTNSLVNVSREKFKIGKEQFLIVVGNPPYNDTTSLYKKNEKGKIECDEDVYDRDMGIAFLKAYAKLDADIICILHPLSYLIKEANFKRLKGFTNSYRIKDGYIFSSKEFLFTKDTEFPVVIALYEKNKEGMNYDYIRDFEFKLLNSNKRFILSNYETIDGYIHKYPPRKNEPKLSSINIYYYTFRDLNSTLRNTTFLDKEHSNGIPVNKENFYKYAYLYCLKKFVSKIKKQKEDLFIFGNISPLVNKDFVEKNKELFVIYALKDHKLFKKYLQLVKELFDFYKINDKNIDLQKIEKKLNNYFASLYNI